MTGDPDVLLDVPGEGLIRGVFLPSAHHSLDSQIGIKAAKVGKTGPSWLQQQQKKTLRTKLQAHTKFYFFLNKLMYQINELQTDTNIIMTGGTNAENI